MMLRKLLLRQLQKRKSGSKLLDLTISTYMENHQTPPGPLKLDHITGEYVVKCEKLDDYCDYGHVKALHIHKSSNSSTNRVEAAFDFGLMEGTMLLALSDDALCRLRQDLEVDSDEDSDEDSDADPDTADGYYYSQKQKAERNTRPLAAINRRLGETPSQTLCTSSGLAETQEQVRSN